MFFEDRLRYFSKSNLEKERAGKPYVQKYLYFTIFRSFPCSKHTCFTVYLSDRCSKTHVCFTCLTWKREVIEKYSKTLCFFEKSLFSTKNSTHETLAKYTIFGHPPHIYTAKYVGFILDMLGFDVKHNALKPLFGSLWFTTT